MFEKSIPMRSLTSLAAVDSPVGFALALICAATAIPYATAQDGSLLQVPPVLQHARDPNSGTLTLDNSSFIFQKLPPEHQFRELKINDIITVLVDYRTSLLSEGDAEARKTNNLNAFLNNWVKFDGKNLTPDPQPNGPLAVSGNLQSQFRVQSDMELRDQLTFRIAAYIVDIQPNGNLVIQGYQQTQVSNEVRYLTVSGVIRAQDITRTNTVSYEKIADAQIAYVSSGDATSTPEMKAVPKLLDRFNPF